MKLLKKLAYGDMEDNVWVLIFSPNDNGDGYYQAIILFPEYDPNLRCDSMSTTTTRLGKSEKEVVYEAMCFLHMREQKGNRAGLFMSSFLFDVEDDNPKENTSTASKQEKVT